MSVIQKHEDKSGNNRCGNCYWFNKDNSNCKKLKVEVDEPAKSSCSSYQYNTDYFSGSHALVT